MNRTSVAVDTASQYSRAIHGWAYVVLAVWSLMLFIFTIARLIYTLSPRTDRFLNNGAPFYESSVMELVVCALLGLAFSGVMIFVLRSRNTLGFVSKNGFEVGVLIVQWFLWVGGAGSATTIWPNLNFCVRFSTCRVLQAMMAWAWLGWITISFLLGASLFFAIKTGRWNAQIPISWELKNPSPPEFTIDGEERGIRPQMGMREGSGKARATDDADIDRDNYEFERWKRAVTWLQQENPDFGKELKDSRNVPSTSA
ncbi:hypothetical protein M408DRAFT_67817 [Serendipita vermifera MAFF 305830]|uniref:MARVEL domain-containing protein n=1 Tax=Serendipita vermifera MAFF 305830 TaxID=933852 RepID=A0A0C3BD99_SERVB|nr:hypothetical protein M408DRAFT_67817 [Serendipita vermifera MAFF 305830]